MSFKNPLSVYIIWHPDYLAGQHIADLFYSTLCRDSSKPLIRSLGIPVYFRSTKLSGHNYPKEIDFKESEYTAVVLLISDEFIIDGAYESYLDLIIDTCQSEPSKRRIYPVALSQNAYHISSKLTPINFIRILNRDKTGSCKETEIVLFKQIKSAVLHELCRLLLNMKKATDEKNLFTVSPPVKLFISHSKHDDSKLDAIKFRDYINSQTQLKTFFDANDIAFGSNFGEVIRNAAKEKDSALIVFQSDSYADREWCRIEIIEAKLCGCPIVIVNAIQNGEQRVFPYLGNYPSIRYKDNFIEIIDLTLKQVLHNRYTSKLIDSLTDLYKIKATRILSTSPELFNFIQLKKELKDEENFGLVIYPDPPLGSEEMEILNQLDDNFVFITPLTLPSVSNFK